MIKRGKIMRGKLLLLTWVLVAGLSGGGSAAGRPQPSQTNPAPEAQQLPFPAQLRKTVIFIRTNCVHMPTDAELAQMSPPDRARWTNDSIERLRPDELARLKQESYFGTGFIVQVPEPRLGKDLGFLYLVTNRHVAQPGVENGKPCKVVSYSFSLNHRGQSPDSPSHLQSLPANPDNVWTLPSDDSVDLAAAPFALSYSDFDFQWIPLDMFVTQEMIEKDVVVEGDPVIFTGLFIQYTGMTRLEPVVRSGTVAMLPKDPVFTTLRKPGNIFLAEAHAFGGNSGSPMFVDTSRFKNALGYDYKFLGVVTGEIKETADLTLEVSTAYAGTVSANSDVSVIVPAFQVRDLLMSPVFQGLRDAYVASHPAAQPTNQQPTK